MASRPSDLAEIGDVGPPTREGTMSGRILGSTAWLSHVAAITAALIAGLVSSISAQSGLVGRGVQVFDSRWNTESFVEVDAGRWHTLARRSDGTVVAWGDNGYHLRCKVPSNPPGTLYTQVSAGSTHSLARRSDGIVVAWGDDYLGQCNVPPLPPGVRYSAVAAGSDFSVALRNDGSIAAWGNNAQGQCNVPAAPPGLTYVEIDAGHAHAVARLSDGTLTAWGDNSQGQCVVPALPPGIQYAEIAAGGTHTLARRSDGSVVAWGSNSQGQSSVPPVPPGLAFVEISASDNHSVGRLSDGSVIAWGLNGSGQCDVPILPPGSRYAAISAGGNHTTALRRDGRVVAWGDNSVFQCNVPVLPGGLTYVEIATNGGGWGEAQHTLARLSDGSVLDWGSGSGQVPALPTGLKYVEIDAGIAHSIARRSDGSVLAWGDNSYGQCNIPPLPLGLTYTRVAAGSAHSAAVRSDGSIVAWGANWNGQCNVPVLPPGLSYVDVEAGGMLGAAGGTWGSTLAIRSDGSGVAWGISVTIPPVLPDDPYIQASAGGWYEAIFLRQSGSITGLPAGGNLVDIAAGFDHVVGVRSTGSIWAFGPQPWNDFGQAVIPGYGYAFVDVAAGGNQTVARYEGCPTCEVPFCVGDGSSGSVLCPCGNAGAAERGCENSFGTGGARLTADGSVDPDQVTLLASDAIPSTTCIFLQGRSVLGSPVVFGDGVRCIGGTLERIGVKVASTGSARYPGIGDPTISARSAALGDFIRPGTFRYYQVHYRDSDPAFCNPAPATFNASNAVMVRW